MPSRKEMWRIFAVALAVACNEPTLAPDAPPTPNFHGESDRHQTVVVNPNGRHDATTIQAGIDMAPAGGRVLVTPGTYVEALVIAKGVTLDAAGGHSSQIIIAAPAGVADAIQITTTEPVVIRELTVHAGTVHGIHGIGVVAVTVERVTVTTVNPPLGAGRLIRLTNDPNPSGARARFVVRKSFVDGTVINQPLPFPQVFGISLAGDVDAVLEDNVIRRTGGACIAVLARSDLGGVQNVDIVGNDLDECHPSGRAGALTVGLAGQATTLPSATQPITATGIVNIVGNTIRNSAAACVTTTAIHYGLYAGRIEHNRILGVVQACATPTVRVLPAAILLGDNRPFFPAPQPTVRFNDIVGNAQAGLRINPAENIAVDASCNYWGSRSGPTSSAWPTGTGDAIVVETGGATPMFTPFAKKRVARADGHGGDDDDDHKRGGCGSEWSQPVNLGAVINTAASERNESLSPDELSLYFTSDRPGGQGLTDIYVSRRASLRSPWQAPMNLGTVINTAAGELTPTLSSDGHLMYFNSDRAGGFGASDIYVSYRADPTDDLAWGPPVNVGPLVNTAAVEQGAGYAPAGSDGIARLYFDRRSGLGATAPLDIYSVPLTSDGRPSAPAAMVAGVNLPDPVNDFGAEQSNDGRELFFISSRPGGLGGNDIWRSTRRTENDPWSTPENLGSAINTALNDRHPSLSGDGRTLMFASTGHGGFGSEDLFTSTRKRIGHGNSHVARH